MILCPGSVDRRLDQWSLRSAVNIYLSVSACPCHLRAWAAGRVIVSGNGCLAAHPSPLRGIDTITPTRIERSGDLSRF